MIAGDEHDRRAGQRLAQPLELAEGEHDGGVGGTDRMEQIPGDDHEVRRRGDDAVHGEPKGEGHVGLALVDAGRGLAMVLPRPQVRVGQVSHFHSGNVSCRGE